MPEVSEYQEAIALANRILDRTHGDPDDDAAILSRQFLRSVERLAHCRETLFESCIPRHVAAQVQADCRRPEGADMHETLIVRDPIHLCHCWRWVQGKFFCDRCFNRLPARLQETLATAWRKSRNAEDATDYLAAKAKAEEWLRGNR
jgi:hypothetical protein